MNEKKYTNIKFQTNKYIKSKVTSKKAKYQTHKKTKHNNNNNKNNVSVSVSIPI